MFMSYSTDSFVPLLIDFKQMTLADIEVSIGLDWLEIIGLKVNFDDFPKLKAMRERVDAQPAIAAWIAKRPKTDF